MRNGTTSLADWRCRAAESLNVASCYWSGCLGDGDGGLDIIPAGAARPANIPRLHNDKASVAGE
jgi:hypothetical protein